MSRNGISLVFPYHRRADLLLHAVKTWAAQLDNPFFARGGMVELVVVENDDGPSTLPSLESVPFLLQHVKIPTPSGEWHSPGVLWNLGVRLASFDLVLLTHPEIVHFGPVLRTAIECTPEHGLLQFSCRCLKPPPAGLSDDLDAATDRQDLGLGGWYAHPVHRPNLAPWATAMTKDSYRYVGGFDYRFDAVYGYDDADWAIRLLKEFTTDERLTSTDPHVGHLGHPRPHAWQVAASMQEAKAILRRIHGPDADLIAPG